MSRAPPPWRMVGLTPQGKSAMGLDGKHTPFTWYSTVCDPIGSTVTEDKLCLLGTPWAVLVNRLHIAFSYYTYCEFRKGRALLAECYMPLLPFDFFDNGCGIIKDHKKALRHVLDSTWAAMGQLDRMEEEGNRFQPDASWRAFADTITPYGKLGRKQQAAIVAIRGCFESDPELLRKAIALNPKEGEWHYKLGYLLEEQRGPGKGTPTREELAALRRGLELRVNPDTMVRVASSVMCKGPAGVVEAIKLMEEAMERFPNNVRVMWIYSSLSPRLFDGRAVPDGRSRKQLLERCLALLGGRCAYALFAMGFEMMKSHVIDGDCTMGEAQSYIDQAYAVNRVATIAAQEELTGGGAKK